MIQRHLALFLLLVATLHAHRPNQLDTLHHYLSLKVHEYSKIIDQQLSHLLLGESNQTHCTIYPSRQEDNRSAIEHFFQDEKFLHDSGESFVRLRSDTLLSKGGVYQHTTHFSTQLPLPLSRQHFQLFVENLTRENASNLLHNRSDDEIPQAEIGIHYFLSHLYGIESKYSLAMRGINPFIRAKYSRLFEVGEWRIEPTQSFEYSVEHAFEEESNLYFDYPLSSQKLLRLRLHRKSTSEDKGMEYALSAEYFWAISHKRGLKLSQSFWGDTGYTYTQSDGTERSFEGIHNYITAMSYRANIWREWLFYEIIPAVNFHQANHYRANYSLHFLVDFYFR